MVSIRLLNSWLINFSDSIKREFCIFLRFSRSNISSWNKNGKYIFKQEFWLRAFSLLNCKTSSALQR